MSERLIRIADDMHEFKKGLATIVGVVMCWTGGTPGLGDAAPTATTTAESVAKSYRQTGTSLHDFSSSSSPWEPLPSETHGLRTVVLFGRGMTGSSSGLSLTSSSW